MYWISWYVGKCLHCEAENWFCNGDETDCTVSDVAGVICWKCKGKLPTTEEGMGDLYDEEVDDMGGLWVKGKKNPE